MVQASVQGLLGDLSGVHGKVKRDSGEFQRALGKNCGILLPKLFWPIVRKKCSSDREKLLKIKGKGQEFANILRLLKQFIQTVNFW